MFVKQGINFQAFTKVTMHLCVSFNVDTLGTEELNVFPPISSSNRKPKYPFLLSSWFKYFAIALITILPAFFSLLPQMLGRPPLYAPHLPQLGRKFDSSPVTHFYFHFHFPHQSHTFIFTFTFITSHTLLRLTALRLQVPGFPGWRPPWETFQVKKSNQKTK